MSRVLPNAMVAQAFRKLGIGSELLEADLPSMVDLGLQKLYGFQHNDGGWGWWYDDSSEVNQTAYVLFGLAMTEQAGFDVDDAVMGRGVEALGPMLAEADPRAQAYGAYVLAMAGQPLTVTMNLTDALNLDLFSQAALALALDATGRETMTLAVLDNLRESAVQDATTVHWPDEGDAAYSRKVMGSSVRTTAMVADALARLDPESPLLPKAVRWLMGRRQGLGWGDTQKTSFALLALTDYLLASGDLAAGSAFRVYINDELWREGILDRAEVGQTLVLTSGTELSPSIWLPGENHVTLVLGAEGEAPFGLLHYAATTVVSRGPQEGTIPALVAHERAIGIRREYRLYGSEEAATEFERGDVVEVQLALSVPEESWYVVVDDPLPAGFEALNERLGTTSHVATVYEDPVYTWQQYGYNRKDVRDERVNFFVTHLEPGQRTLTYLVRATSTGSFTALPTQVYPMYEPEVWSRSESARCQVRPR
jgi:uncharacterized protein YfaS (alpha-2-macroglobulin family)